MFILFIAGLLSLLLLLYFKLYRVPSTTRSFVRFAFPYSNEEPLVCYEGEFSVVTYNIAGLPQLISSATTERSASITEIGKRLNEYDIVHVQEDFNYNSFLYSRNEHPYKTKTKGGIPFGDGLNTLSNFRILELHRIPWNNCTGADCLTPKGFTYSQIEVAKDVFIDFYNVHANAADDPAAAAARRKNIIQLSNYIKAYSADRAVIVMGDLNAHFCYEHDNIRELLEDNQLEDAWIALKANNCFPAFRSFIREDILGLNDDCESIDKILYRSNAELLITPRDYRFENKKFNNDEGQPLSDHCPVSLSFNWKQIRS